MLNKKPTSTSMALVMDYMQQRIDQMDETRKKLKAKYPDLLPTLI